MKAIVGGAIGAAALGGALLLANTRSAAPAGQGTGPAATVASTNLAQAGSLSVDCGAGRMALLKPVAPGQQYSQVECVPSAAVVEPQAYAQPQGSYLVQASYPAQPAVQERVVYRDRVVERPVTRTRTTARRSVAYTPARTEVKQGRSWKKSALIIGGSAAGGAGVGALLGGGSGAKKGAVVGGIGGLVYDLATRNK
jgi:hypothetical protein